MYNIAHPRAHELEQLARTDFPVYASPSRFVTLAEHFATAVFSIFWTGSLVTAPSVFPLLKPGMLYMCRSARASDSLQGLLPYRISRMSSLEFQEPFSG
jgi:hypothetical protein